MNTIQSRAGSGVKATSLRLPEDLLKEVKIQAIKAGRSLNTHVVMILKEATGAEFGDRTPAAEAIEEKSPNQGAFHHDGDDSAIR